MAVANLGYFDNNKKMQKKTILFKNKKTINLQ